MTAGLIYNLWPLSTAISQLMGSTRQLNAAPLLSSGQHMTRHAGGREPTGNVNDAGRTHCVAAAALARAAHSTTTRINIARRRATRAGDFFALHARRQAWRGEELRDEGLWVVG